MAIQTKILNANGSKGHHKFKLTVNEETTSGNSSYMSYSFTIAPIQSGWDWSGHNIPYSITIGSNTYTGNISSYNGSSTVTLKSGSNIEIAHDTDGTKTINISFSVTDTTGQNYTCGNASASDTFKLTDLHKAPTIQTADMIETNQAMINLGVPNTTIVRWLSQKQITLHATPFDSATLTYRLRHPGYNYELPSSGYQSSNVFNADYRTNEFGIGYGNKAYIIQIIKDSKNAEVSDHVRVLINNVEALPNSIPYSKPSIERATTSIKRKSGGGVNLTDNKATLNLKATIYKANDVIGNNNSLVQIGYKVWDSDTSEPANYTSITPTPTPDTDGVITVSDYEISGVSYTDVYNYKIIVKDNYNYEDVIEGSISTGVSVWTEYKDRVNFISATIGGNAIVESGTGYVKYYDGTMICYGSSNTGTITWSQDASIYYAWNFTLPDFAETFISAPIVSKTIQDTNTSRMIWITGNTAPSTTNPGTYNLATYWNATNTNVTVSYIAIGKWR